MRADTSASAEQLTLNQRVHSFSVFHHPSGEPENEPTATAEFQRGILFGRWSDGNNGPQIRSPSRPIKR